MNPIAKHSTLPILAVICCILLPEEVMALQTHSEPEGIYVHQMAHILYIAALIYLFWDTKRSIFSGRGWTYLRVFCVLTIVWNILAVAGHYATQHLTSDDFTSINGYLFSKVNMPISFVKATYYTAKLDHLLTVPAMVFLCLSLRSFYKQSLEEDEV